MPAFAGMTEKARRLTADSWRRRPHADRRAVKRKIAENKPALDENP
jgi:hypothetical protein